MLCMLQLKSEGLEVSFQKWLGWTVKTLRWRIENVTRTLFRFGAGRLVAGPAKLGADWKRVGQSYKQSLFNAFSLNIFYSPLNIFSSPPLTITSCFVKQIIIINCLAFPYFQIFSPKFVNSISPMSSPPPAPPADMFILQSSDKLIS